MSEGELVPVCLLLSCVSCEGVDPTFTVNVLLEISSGSAG